MRFRLLVLAVLLAVFAIPALAQDTNTIVFNNFSFSFNPAVATSVNVTQYPGDPADLQSPGGPEVRHTQFALYAAPPAPESFFDSQVGIRVYRTADFAGYEFPQQQLQQLQSLLSQRPDLAQFMQVTENQSANALPFMPVLPAGQVLRARAQYIETPAFQGISYVTNFRQDASPILGSEFLYTFQGISKDGATYVSAIFPLNTGLFPAETPSDFDYDAFIATINDYFTESTATLNAATPDDFTPSLSTLDALIQTFAFTRAGAPGVAATETVVPSSLGGLGGVTWTLVSYGSPDSPLAALANAPITLIFSEEGITGSAGCNPYFGGFQFDNNALTFSDIGSTLMACEQPILDQETAYLNALRTATSFQITDGQVQIFYQDGVLTFTSS